MTGRLKDRAATAGIGQTEFSKESGRSELQLACEAVAAALADAGLTPADADGLVTFTMDSSDEAEVARSVGIPALAVFSRVPGAAGRRRRATRRPGAGSGPCEGRAPEAGHAEAGRGGGGRLVPAPSGTCRDAVGRTALAAALGISV